VLESVKVGHVVGVNFYISSRFIGFLFGERKDECVEKE
jgi:hypothetical protein